MHTEHNGKLYGNIRSSICKPRKEAAKRKQSRWHLDLELLSLKNYKNTNCHSLTHPLFVTLYGSLRTLPKQDFKAWIRVQNSMRGKLFTESFKTKTLTLSLTCLPKLTCITKFLSYNSGLRLSKYYEKAQHTQLLILRCSRRSNSGRFLPAWEHWPLLP